MAARKRWWKKPRNRKKSLGDHRKTEADYRRS